MVANTLADMSMSATSRTKGIPGRLKKKARTVPQKQYMAGREVSVLYFLLAIVSSMAQLVCRIKSASCSSSKSSPTVGKNLDPTLVPSASKTTTGFNDELPILDAALLPTDILNQNNLTIKIHQYSDFFPVVSLCCCVTCCRYFFYFNLSDALNLTS